MEPLRFANLLELIRSVVKMVFGEAPSTSPDPGEVNKGEKVRDSVKWIEYIVAASTTNYLIFR
jgi:hypothetical protein